MTATSTENVPRYSSTSRNDQLLNRKAPHSDTHSRAMNGISHAAPAPCLRVFHGAGRVLGVWTIMRVASISTRISKSRRDAANGGRNGAVHLRRVFAGALAFEHVYLDQVHGIDIGVAQPDRVREHMIGLQQLFLPRDCKNRAHGAMEFCFEH